MQRATLKPGRERSVLKRHPWIFSGALAEEPEAAPGETVLVTASGGEPLGFASYSPSSQIRARMLSFDPREEPGVEFVRAKVFESVARRGAYFGEAATDAMRLVNAESDGLPGVAADFYAGWCVCQFASAGAERWKDVVAAALMASVPGAMGVAERLDVDARRREGLPTAQAGGADAFRVLAGGEPPPLVEISEGGAKYLVDVRKGHKTGFYLDQRDARAAVARYANGADVLNCFCYTGGFGLRARAAGASSVLQVDSSADALALARKNEALCGACGTEMSYEEADVFRFLRKCRDANRTFDLVVLDPPKFADSKAQAMKAARGYKDINLLAMKLLRPGGVLATFSCSGAVGEDLFMKILAGAAEDAGRVFQVAELCGQPSDHPVALAFPEGRYLKGAILRLV